MCGRAAGPKATGPRMRRVQDRMPITPDQFRTELASIRASLTRQGHKVTEMAAEAFEAVYRSWHQGDLDVPVPGGETGQQVLDRVVPVLTELRLRHLDDHRWPGDIVVVSHGAAIRLVASVLAGVDGAFALDHHLNNTESVIISPITDGRWSCVRWGPLTPPFYPDAAERDAADTAGPMG